MEEKTSNILKKIRSIELRSKKIVDSVFSGVYHSTFKGRGIEFDEARNYIDGDDIRTIDWNVTARMNQPFVKKFKEERELTLTILFDASASNEFGSTTHMRGEAAAELSAIIAFSAIKNNDNVGLIIFTDKVETYIPPKKGRTHVLRVIRELLYFKTDNKKTDINKALQFLSGVQKKKGIVFLISDMYSPDFGSSLSIMNRIHDFTAIRFTDPIEKRLPDIGLLEIEDSETGANLLVDTSNTNFRKEYAEKSAENEKQIESIFKKRKIDFASLSLDRDYIDDFVRFAKKRAGKIK